MDVRETVLKITGYDEILSLRGERLLLVTDHEEIFSIDEVRDMQLVVPKDPKVRKRPIYEEDDDFFDYIKEVENQKFDFKRFFNYKQKRISTKCAKENLHSKGDFPLVNSIKETSRREKLPYCQSEIFPNPDNSSSFFKRWHNFSLPRFTIYRMSKLSVGSLQFDQIASTLTLEAHDGRISNSEFDFENSLRLNNLLNKDGKYKNYGLKSHLRQHKEDHDILELFRIYSVGLKKAPPVHYDSDADIKPSLKYIASLQVLDSEKALIESARRASIKSSITFLEEKEKIWNRTNFEQKKSILPDFMYTGEEQFRVIVYDEEVPYLNFELDTDNRNRVRTTESKESILRLRPDLRNIKLITDSELLSDTSLIGMGDYGIKPEDIGKPVMLKFKNMPELLGWFRKINETEMDLFSSETDSTTKAKVLNKITSKHRKNLREIVVKTPMVGLKKFQPLDPKAGIEFKRLEITTHDTILSILPKSAKKDHKISDSDSKEECISMETVVDRFTSCVIKKEPTHKSVTYKTRSLQKDSLQRIKSSIVNEVVKKVASYFSKDLKPKLEASIKEGQCKCCKKKVATANKFTGVPQFKQLPLRGCTCIQKKAPKISKGVNVDSNELSNDTPNDKCPPAGCRPNFHIFACPTMTYFRNTGVNANTIEDYGSCGDSLPPMSFDCQKMLEMYGNLAKTVEEQMIKLREYQSLIEKPVEDIKFCSTVIERKISKNQTIDELNNLIINNDLKDRIEEYNLSHVPADMSSHVLDRIFEDLQKRKKSNSDVAKSLEPNSSEQPTLVHYMLDSCSSNESMLSHYRDILNVKIVEEVPKSNMSVCKITSHKEDIMDDTYNITDISDFECYINYICTHSEKFLQISEDLIAKKLKRQTSDNNLVNLKRNSHFGLKHFGKCGKIDSNNNIENNNNELVTIFKRNCKKWEENKD